MSKLSDHVVLLLLSSTACGPGSSTDSTNTTTTTMTSTSSSSSESTGPDTSEMTETTDDPTDCTGVGCHDYGPPHICDLFLQDCPPGEKCVPLYDNGDYAGDQCIPVNGDGQPGEPCSGDGFDPGADDCGPDSWCLAGICHPFCTGDRNDAICIDGWACVQPASDPSICVESCNPLTQPCSGEQDCLWMGTSFGCGPTGQGLPHGEPCMFANDCELGICVDPSLFTSCAGSGCCATFCSLAAGDGPCQAIDPAYVCEAFFLDPAPAGYEDIGVCILPP